MNICELHINNGKACVPCARNRTLKWINIHAQERLEHNRKYHKERYYRNLKESREYSREKGKALYLSNKIHYHAVRMITSARRRAKTKNLPITISVNWAEQRLKIGVCELCGLRFQYGWGIKMSPYSPTIDRIDNRYGYTPDNCRMIVWGINLFFGKWGEELVQPIALAYARRLLSTSTYVGLTESKDIPSESW